MKSAVCRTAWLAFLFVCGCSKDLPTQPAMPPTATVVPATLTPTATPTGTLAGTWTGTMRVGSNAYAVTAQVTQGGQTVHMRIARAGTNAVATFDGGLTEAQLSGRYCPGVPFCCTDASGTASVSQIHLSVQAGQIVDANGNPIILCPPQTIELSR